jgi:hypothetical protein
VGTRWGSYGKPTAERGLARPELAQDDEAGWPVSVKVAGYDIVDSSIGLSGDGLILEDELLGTQDHRGWIVAQEAPPYGSKRYPVP